MRDGRIVCVLALLLLISGCGEGNGEATTTTASSQTTAPAPELENVVLNASGGEEVRVKAEIADTDEERRRGLMDRTSLGENRGMLFVFDGEQRLSFWMKNTKIPLSVAYIDSEERIVDVQQMQPMTTTSHPSSEPARYALEVNQGFFREHGVTEGDTVELPDVS
jgi:uncharacterized membrane protein (UPF0127 family)